MNRSTHSQITVVRLGLVSLLAIISVFLSVSIEMPEASADSIIHEEYARAMVDTIPSSRRTSSFVEEFTFWITDWKMEHQSEVNHLNIHVRYRYIAGIVYPAYPDFRLILKDIEDFLTSYPNELDYWEIVNKRTGQMALKKYPVISTITIEIRVSPSQLDPYLRASIVTCKRSRLTKAGRKPRQVHKE